MDRDSLTRKRLPMTYATLKPLHRAVLTLPNGRAVEVERIGRGRYTTAWANGSHVYLQTHEKDASKEILEVVGRGERATHIPDCRHLGAFAGPYRLYSMPKYDKVTARTTPAAWAQLQALIKLREEAWQLALKRENRAPDGYAINDAFRELLDDVAAGCGLVEPGVLPNSLVEALRAVLDEAANYGEYTIEFRRANVAADKQGRLILLDPLFDGAEVRKANQEAQRKARGW